MLPQDDMFLDQLRGTVFLTRIDLVAVITEMTEVRHAMRQWQMRSSR